MSADAPRPALPTPQELRERLERLRAARGFLLAHHGAMAAAAPDLHQAYLEMYRALTLVDRHLDPLAKESVWLAILVTTGESVGTHHLELFIAAGGDTAAARSLLSMAAHAQALDTLLFADRHWSDYMPGLDAVETYRRGLEGLRADSLAPRTAELAMLAVHTARASHDGIAHHIRHCYEIGVAEEQMVEALGYLIWPCGVNTFLEACTIWHGLMRRGEVRPSPLFEVWAAASHGAYSREGEGGPGDFTTGHPDGRR